MNTILASLKITLTTMLVCVAGYSLLVWSAGRLLVPELAEGSLLRRSDGSLVGSRLIAQKFEQPRYFWPRPSAVDYNGAGAGGSNKSPTSSDLTERAATTVAAYGATADNPLPADLAAASGGGLDPHISARAAFYQARRVAEARGRTVGEIERLIQNHAFSPGGPLTSDRLVNVLELNLALDEQRS
ncbi:MAG: potassium-transporting ATPase subunit C [Vulcanimicrobiota bacterium]